MALHPLQTNPAFAEKEFDFLARLGFALQERWVTGGESFCDGWRLTFLGPKIKVVVQYTPGGALAWGDVDQATVTPALALLDSMFAILWRLTDP